MILGRQRGSALQAILQGEKSLRWTLHASQFVDDTLETYRYSERPDALKGKDLRRAVERVVLRDSMQSGPRT